MAGNVVGIRTGFRGSRLNWTVQVVDTHFCGGARKCYLRFAGARGASLARGVTVGKFSTLLLLQVEEVVEGLRVLVGGFACLFDTKGNTLA